MREICTSGSTRGEWVALLCCPLSYSTGLLAFLCALCVLCPENPYAAMGVVSTFRPSSSKRFV